MFSSLQNWVLKRKEHIVHRMAVSVMPDHRKYFMQALYNSHLIIIATFSLVFMYAGPVCLLKYM